MIKNTHYHLNKFIKWTSWCNCPGDGVFFIEISSWIPTLSNISWTITSFPTSPFLKRFIKTLSITADWIYWFRAYDWDVMFDDILTCPNTFVPSIEAKDFVFNTNNCEDLDDWFFWIKVLWCNASYVKVFNYDDCWIDAPTWLTSNWYTCWDVILSWNDVTGASSYTITQWVNTYTSTISMVTIPYTSSWSKIFSVVANWIAWPSIATTITVNTVQCAIMWLNDNDYIYWGLTLSWEEDPSATYYQIVYWATTTTVTDPEIFIPFTTWGNVTYQVSSCDGSWCSVATSIVVTMMQSNVTWISNWLYSCWDITITRSSVLWATSYLITYWLTSVTSLTNSIVIPFTTSWSTSYTIKAWNENWYNDWWSSSFTMQSCWISWLSYWSYSCWDVTIDRNNVATANSYTVSYGLTSTTVAVSTITIPYTTPWLVTYMITAFNGATELTSVTIDVTMVACSDYFGNLYVQQVWPTWLTSDWTLTIIWNNSPTDPISDTTYFDPLWFWEVSWYAWSMSIEWMRQDPTTKKVFYRSQLWLHVWQSWKKSVTQLSSNGWWTKPARLSWDVWYYNAADGKLYKWTDLSIWTLKATYTWYKWIFTDRWSYISIWNNTGTTQSLDSNWWVSFSTYWWNSEIEPINITPHTYTNWTTQPANIMFRSWQFYVWHSRVWWYWGNPLSWLTADLLSTWCWTLNIRQMRSYGEYLYIIYDYNWSELDLTLTWWYYKPSNNTQLAIVKIITARVTSLYDSWDYEIINTDLITTKQSDYFTIGTIKYYPSRFTHISVNTCPDWYIYMFWIWSYSDWSTSYWVGKWFAIKVELDGTSLWDITQIPLWYNWTVCEWHNIHTAEAFRI